MLNRCTCTTAAGTGAENLVCTADRGYTVQPHRLALWQRRSAPCDLSRPCRTMLYNNTEAEHLAAFDKGDLLYMRDEEEKRRFMEQQLRDGERSQFRKLQAAESLPARESLPEPAPRLKDRPPSRYCTPLLPAYIPAYILRCLACAHLAQITPSMWRPSSCVCCRPKAPPMFTVVSKAEKPQDTAPRIPRPSAAPDVQPAKKPRLSPAQPSRQSSQPAPSSSQLLDRGHQPDPPAQKQGAAVAHSKPEEEPAAGLAGLLGDADIACAQCLLQTIAARD